MKHYPQAFLAVCMLAGLLAQAPVHAQNIVQDPSFESANAGTGAEQYSAPAFIGDGVWQVTTGRIDAVNNFPFFTLLPHSGSQFVYLTPDAGISTLSQALVTLPGTRYDLSFFAAANNANTFAVSFGGFAVAGIPAALPNTSSSLGGPLVSTSYRKYTATGLLATGGSTALSFSAANTFGYTLLDDVSVTASAPSVPEPGSVALLVGLGVTGTSFAFRRYRKAVHKAA